MKTIAQRAADLSFRPLCNQPQDDQRAILNIRNEAKIRANMYRSTEIGTDEHSAWLANLKKSKTDSWFLIYADDQLIGSLGFTNINLTHRRADWAFYLSTGSQGHGYGAASEYFALDLGFGAMGLNKLNCEVIAWNTAVIGLHKKFGFSEEGQRRAHVWRENLAYDVVLLGILADEWSITRQKFERKEP